MPRGLVDAAGQTAWMALPIGALVPLLSLFMIERICRRVPGVNFIELNQRLLGKTAGFIMVMLFILYIIVFESIVIRTFADVTKIYMLPATPLWVILLLVAFSVYYVISKGSRVVARINELIFYILLITLIIALVPLPMGDYNNLLPLWEIDPAGLMKGVLYSAFAFEGLEILLVIYSLVDKKERIIKAGLTAIGITLGVYIYIIILGILVFGLDLIKLLLWPGIYYYKTVSFTAFPRLEFFLLAFWIGLGARPAFTMGFAASLSLSQLFNINDNRFHLVALAAVTAMFGLALIPGDIFAVFKIWDYVGLVALAVSLLYPAGLHLAAFIGGLDHEK
ncbi:GerAB/ArcD/ProY family transporter [Syntrophomonas palmitatica]|uniref:GerAB/ArcD/ProY family transporter n=1 Tax=Syntrophomonas palmitatica TaxID=402877 RepID=UPI00241ED613|nr:endospore germination permease [Syntrophomonas palmitatica]